MNHATKFLVGDLAKKFGISPQTVHWYEAQGLLPRAQRGESGYRHYSREAVDQLAFVRRALSIGFSVKEIKLIVQARSDGQLPCDLVVELLTKKMLQIDEQIKTLQDVRLQMQELHQQWVLKLPTVHEHASQVCPLIEET
jgi:DNA-binding transcriptional MerR regulator